MSKLEDIKKWISITFCNHDWWHYTGPIYNVECSKCKKKDVFNTHG